MDRDRKTFPFADGVVIALAISYCLSHFSYVAQLDREIAAALLPLGVLAGMSGLFILADGHQRLGFGLLLFGIVWSMSLVGQSASSHLVFDAMMIAGEVGLFWLATYVWRLALPGHDLASNASA